MLEAPYSVIPDFAVILGLTELYLQAYNRTRPHRSPGYTPPAPETIMLASPVTTLVGLTYRVVQPPGAGQLPRQIGRKKRASE